MPIWAIPPPGRGATETRRLLLRCLLAVRNIGSILVFRSRKANEVPTESMPSTPKANATGQGQGRGEQC